MKPRDALLSAAANRAMFNRIARRYDLMNAILSLGRHRRWRRRAVAELDPQPGGRYLDVGCGTGDVAIEVLRRQPLARVVGIDPAGQMRALAEAKAARAGLAGAISLQGGDATELPFPAGSFLGVISAFCLRNVTDRSKALAEMHRALVPGGRAVVLELAVPRGRALRLGHRLYTRCLVPLVGRWIAGDRDAYQYLVDSVHDLAAREGLLGAMAAAGFPEPRCLPLDGGVVALLVARKQ